MKTNYYLIILEKIKIGPMGIEPMTQINKIRVLTIKL